MTLVESTLDTRISRYWTDTIRARLSTHVEQMYRYRLSTPRLQPVRCDDKIVFLDRPWLQELIGHVDLTVLTYGELYIDYFEVLEPFRGMGYGREMYEWVEDYALRRGARTLILTSYQDAIEFWLKMGFRFYEEPNEMIKVIR